MHQVVENVFIGDSEAALSLGNLTHFNIRGVVCAAVDHPRPFGGQIDYSYFPLVDDLNDNVLRYVDDCYVFIRGHVASGTNVLVHCVQGVSRSVALVTGYIMKDKNLSFDEAYSIVTNEYPSANMAENFRDQLDMYGRRFAWDMRLESQEHRIYRTKFSMCIGENQGTITGTTSRFICRKCRQCLFLDMHVVEQDADNRRFCSNILVECMQWMESQVKEHKGAISCPGCSGKIGSYDWTGPHFVITQSKVDEMPLHCRYVGEEHPLTLF